MDILRYVNTLKMLAGKKHAEIVEKQEKPV
jgi:hypothetical protein